MNKKIFQNLKKIIPENRILNSAEEIYAYANDNNCNITSNNYPTTIILPETTKEIQAIMKFANENKIAVIARGAGTNHVGACVFKQSQTHKHIGSIVLHFSKMNKIIEISKENLYAKVQPGAVIADIQTAVEKENLFYPPDPSNLKVSTIGGALALSSGGPRSLKYGTAKDYVLNLKVVLASGELIETGSDCAKNVAGFNLTSLFVGSEGTLGIITEATLKLVPKPQSNKILLAYFDSIEAATATVNSILDHSLVPSVVDLLDKFTLQTIENFFPTGLLTNKEALLFIELDGDEIALQIQEKKILSLLDSSSVKLIDSQEEKLNFWTARRASFAATSQLKGNVLTEDIVVPRSKIVEAIIKIKEILRENHLTACIMGHIGDGNIHPNFALNFDDKNEMQRFFIAKNKLFNLAIALGGTVSGEHGIGFEKIDYLKNYLSPSLIRISKSIKYLLDPNNILNPNKIFDFSD